MNETGRVRPLHRVFAKFVDLFLVMLVAAALPYPFGPFLGFVYSLFSDALPIRALHGQSIGKKLFRLKVVSLKSQTESNLPANPQWKDSLYRNAPVGVATFFSLVPVWGWAILALVGFPLMIIEIYLLVRAPRGQRLGDVMADTQVISLPSRKMT